MKNIKSVIIGIVILAILIIVFHFNVGQVTDRAMKVFIMSSTTLSKTIEVKEMTVISKGGETVSLKSENGDIFDIVDTRFKKGDIVEVGLDTMGTASPVDDAVVWTIKK